jgi:hypothetical protein
VDDDKRKAGKKGGLARAEALSSEERKEIAKLAASARWHKDIPRATHAGVLEIGDSSIPCYVLETGERVLSTRGIMKSLGRTWRGRKYAGTQHPVFLEANNLKPYLAKGLDAVLSPKIFRTDRGGTGEGFSAEILPLICETYLAAKDADALTASQTSVAKQCEILVRGLSRVGVIALVDEATGYQEVRDKMALQAILDSFLRKELAAWAKRFPDEFYEHIFRLRGWQWKGRAKNPPQVVAAYTKDFVYARLAPQILEELERRNPIEDGKRKGAHHQWLTDDVGHPALAQHLHAVITLMRVSKSWAQFKLMLDIAHPKRDDTLQLPLMADFKTDPIKRLSEPGGQRSLFDKDETAN